MVDGLGSRMCGGEDGSGNGVYGGDGVGVMMVWVVVMVVWVVVVVMVWGVVMVVWALL